MSTFKISELTSIGRAPSNNDTFVINDNSNPATPFTRAINFKQLTDEIISSAGVSLQPIFFSFGVSYTGVAATFDTVQSIDKVFDPNPVKTVDMPDGCDRAIVINSYGSSIRSSPLIRAGNSTNAMAQFQYSVTLTNATWRFSPDPTQVKMAMGTAHHMPAGYNYGITDAYASQNDSSRPNIIEFAENASVSFELDVAIRRAKKCIPTVGGGRMMIFPYSSTSEVSAMIDNLVSGQQDEMVGYSTASTDPNVFDPLTPAEAEHQNSQDIKNEIQYVIDRITQTLEYDDQLATNFPDSNYPNPLDGTTSNITTLLTNLRKAAYDLKYSSSTDVTDYDATLDLIIFGDEPNSRPGLSGYIGYNFGFETITTRRLGNQGYEKAL